MYQADFFTNSINRMQLAPGGDDGYVAMVAVYPDNEWVLKTARYKDGTLNFLEWCYSLQKAGKSMRGMPEIDALVHTTDGYAVAMRFYTRYQEVRGEVDSYEDAEYIKELCAAYLEYCKAAFVVRVNHYLGDDQPKNITWRTIEKKSDVMGDMHDSNHMWDHRTGTHIITDPSAMSYMLPAIPGPLILQ